MLAAAVLVILIVAFVWVRSSIGAGRETLASVTHSLESIAGIYDEKLLDLTKALDMERFQRETTYQTAFKADVYRFLNGQEDRGTFYLLDGDESLAFTSARSDAEREKTLTLIRWRITRMLKSGERDHVITLCHDSEPDERKAELLIGRSAEDGYLCVSLPAAVFERRLPSQSADVIVTDAFGAIYFENTTLFDGALGKIDKQAEAYRGFVRRGNAFYYVCQGTALQGMLHVYAVRSVGDLVYMVLLMSALVAVLVTVLVVVILSGSGHIAREKTAIIDEIVLAFQRAQRGELTTRLSIQSSDEFEIISDAYNSMLDSIQELMDRNVLQAQETAVSRVRQLEAQFNPHFLFNTLENVRFMVRLDPKAADMMILCLSRLLRYSIKSSAQDVTLQEDISYVYNYLSILKYRFGERLTYRIDVPEELENCRLPKLIVQPILENAIIHGMEERERLHVHVQVSVRDGMLCICIRDNGPGIRPDKYAQIMEKMNAEHIHVGEHMGMLNVHYRLRLIYGGRSGLEIDTHQDEGTEVRLILPLVIREGDIPDDSESVDRRG